MIITVQNRCVKFAVKQPRGFTIVEVIVILAIIGILAAVAVPVALKIFERTAEEATREEMNNLKRAMIGDTRKLQGSFRSDFGFLGDIGCLPDNLRRLLSNPPSPPPVLAALPTWTFDSAKQAGAGWKGPYITGSATGEEAEEYTKDQWGNDYAYSASCSPSPVATLTSNGPDGDLATATDNIVLDVITNETTATVRGTVKDSTGNPLANVSVDFNYPSNGTLFTATPVSDSNGNYSVAGVPYGARSIQAKPTLVVVPGSVTISGGANNNVNFNVANYSSSSITVSHMTIVCAGTGAAKNSDIRIDGSIVDGTNRVGCGTQRSVSGSNTTWAANPTPLAPLRVFVDSPDTQLPDLTVKGGTITRTVTLEDFEDSGNGNSDMRNGKTITVTFYSSVSTVITTVTVTTP